MTPASKTILGGIALVAIAAGVFAYVNKAKAPGENEPISPAPTPSPQPSPKFVYENKYGFEISFPSEFTTRALLEKEAYPGRSHVGGEEGKLIADFLEATLIRPSTERDFPIFEALVYKLKNKTLDEWLEENSIITVSFGEKKTVTLGTQQFYKYTYPAGDLVPGAMYIIANSDYVVQLNTDMDLSGLPIAHTAEEILKSFKFK